MPLSPLSKTFLFDSAFVVTLLIGYFQVRREGGLAGKLPRAPRRFGAPPSLRKIKYTRMHPLEKKNSKLFSLEGLREMFGGPGECFPGPRCGSRRAWLFLSTFYVL